MNLAIKDIKPNPDNPRVIKDDNFKKLVQSLKDFPEMAEVREIIVNKDHVILGGNMRYKAMLEAGWSEAPVKIVDWPEAKQKEFIVKDNVSGGEWDYDILANQYEMEQLDAWGVDLPEYLNPEDDVEEDEAPEVSDEPPKSKLGEVYQLGRHRVMCGDSTDQKLGDQMFNYGDVQLILTDPPYNLGFDYNEYDDNKSVEKYSKMLSESITRYSVNKVVTTGKQNLKLWYELENIEDVAIWYSKNKMSGGKISNLSLWEPIVFIGKFDRNTRPNDVLEYTNENQKDTGDHTCPKTVKLFSELLKYSKKGDGVFDPYLGSGTTLIACEQTDRTCYGMELDPKYVDVIRKRYAKFISKEDQWEEVTPCL